MLITITLQLQMDNDNNNDNNGYVSLSPYNPALIDSNIPQLAQQIFSKPFQPPCTIMLELDAKENDQEIPTRTASEAQTVFEVLANILLFGIRVKYGENQNPKKLNEKQILEMKGYMQSMGFDVTLRTYMLNDPDTIRISEHIEKEKYKPTDIEFYRLRMIDNELGEGCDVLHDIKIHKYVNPNDVYVRQLL
jgi:hypothetical protein